MRWLKIVIGGVMMTSLTNAADSFPYTPLATLQKWAGPTTAGSQAERVSTFVAGSKQISSYALHRTGAPTPLCFLTVLESAGAPELIGTPIFAETKGQETVSVQSENFCSVFAEPKGEIWVVQSLHVDTQREHTDGHDLCRIFVLSKPLNKPVAVFENASGFEVDQRNDLTHHFGLDDSGRFVVTRIGRYCLFDPDTRRIHEGKITTTSYRWNGSDFIAGAPVTENLAPGDPL